MILSLRHYTPSNGKAFFFGDDPENERLEKIDEFYSGMLLTWLAFGDLVPLIYLRLGLVRRIF